MSQIKAKIVDVEPEASHGTYRSYSIGFLLSIACTLIAYVAVATHTGTKHIAYAHPLLIAFIVIAAFAQLVVQLVFFLHLGKESGRKWNLIVFMFMVLVVTILVGGSLWIMQNLQYHHMHGLSPRQQNTYIIKDERINK
jgi:cytochrome o ubiquinol oxidase operon protein cyoD